MMRNQTFTPLEQCKATSSCEEIGNIIVCLYYLSSQVKNLGIKSLAGVLNTAIVDIADIGVDSYKKDACLSEQSVKTQEKYDRQSFIFDFCHIEDNSAHLEIENIIQAVR